MQFIWFCFLVDDRWAPMLVKERAARGRFLVGWGVGWRRRESGLVWSLVAEWAAGLNGAVVVCGCFGVSGFVDEESEAIHEKRVYR